MGVAPRRLSGWEPAETTVVHYASAVWWKPWAWNRVVSMIATREPEFDDEQLDLLLASAEFEASIGANGFLRSDAMNPEADPTDYTSSLRFTAAGPFWDYAEQARLNAVDAYKDQFPKDKPPNLNGAYWVVEKHGESSSGEVSEPAE